MTVEDDDRLWRELTRDGCYRRGDCFAIGTQPFAWSESAEGVFIRLKIRERVRLAVIDLLARCGAHFEQFDVQQLIDFAAANNWEPRDRVAPTVREIAPDFGVDAEGNAPTE